MIVVAALGFRKREICFDHDRKLKSEEEMLPRIARLGKSTEISNPSKHPLPTKVVYRVSFDKGYNGTI